MNSHDRTVTAGSADRLIVFDTTLRDGEQSPGCGMQLAEKIRVAKALARLNVDVIEAGFPAASPGDLESVAAVAREIPEQVICALARCHQEDIELAWKAVQDAARPRIHVFLATSAIHREFKLGMAQAEIIRRTRESVMQAREFCNDVEFSPEDASRTELDFLASVVEEAIAAGASTINIPDTVGYSTPDEFGRIFQYLRENVRGIGKIVLSAHCHDDLGLAVANSMAAINAGARQVECTINGIGERAGNCALEEIVMAIKTRSDQTPVETQIETTQLCATSQIVASVTGSRVARNKAIVGENAFAHEAGIHQHGVLKHRATYEIMRAEDVGFETNRLVLGKHSGKHAIAHWAKARGFELTHAQLDKVTRQVKALADRKKTIYDADVVALITGETSDHVGRWELAELQVTCGTSATATSTAAVRDRTNGQVRREAAIGDGPVDATFKAVSRAVGSQASLDNFTVRSVTVGEDAQGEVTLEVQDDGHIRKGRGVSTNIIEASALATVDVINRIERANEQFEAPLPDAANVSAAHAWAASMTTTQTPPPQASGEGAMHTPAP
ncbi:MAG: 2-isopropylmalate synthase [Pirellulales bacterium]|nr:2-isopropylmalate synthase [Pirellulales bacterium]